MGVTGCSWLGGACRAVQLLVESHELAVTATGEEALAPPHREHGEGGVRALGVLLNAVARDGDTPAASPLDCEETLFTSDEHMILLIAMMKSAEKCDDLIRFG